MEVFEQIIPPLAILYIVPPVRYNTDRSGGLYELYSDSTARVQAMRQRLMTNTSSRFVPEFKLKDVHVRPSFQCMVSRMYSRSGWLKALGDEWKMEVLGAPSCSDVAMAPTFALGACPEAQPKL